MEGPLLVQVSHSEATQVMCPEADRNLSLQAGTWLSYRDEEMRMQPEPGMEFRARALEQGCRERQGFSEELFDSLLLGRGAHTQVHTCTGTQAVPVYIGHVQTLANVTCSHTHT